MKSAMSKLGALKTSAEENRAVGGREPPFFGRRLPIKGPKTNRGGEDPSNANQRRRVDQSGENAASAVNWNWASLGNDFVASEVKETGVQDWSGGGEGNKLTAEPEAAEIDPAHGKMPAIEAPPATTVERWTCDKCRLASFETYEATLAHEAQCKAFARQAVPAIVTPPTDNEFTPADAPKKARGRGGRTKKEVSYKEESEEESGEESDYSEEAPNVKTGKKKAKNAKGAKELRYFEHSALESADWLAKRSELAVELAAIADKKMKGKSVEDIMANRRVFWMEFTSKEGKEGTESIRKAFEEAASKAARSIAEFAKAKSNGDEWLETYLMTDLKEKWGLVL